MTRTRRVAAAALLTLALSLTGSTPAMALAPRGGGYTSPCWATFAVVSPLYGVVCAVQSYRAYHR